MTFAELRKEKRLTQVELAKKLGLAQATIAMWETGGAVPTIATAKRVAAVLGCELCEVVNCFV